MQDGLPFLHHASKSRPQVSLFAVNRTCRSQLLCGSIIGQWMGPGGGVGGGGWVGAGRGCDFHAAHMYMVQGPVHASSSLNKSVFIDNTVRPLSMYSLFFQTLITETQSGVCGRDYRVEMLKTSQREPEDERLLLEDWCDATYSMWFILYCRGQHNSPMPTRSVGVPQIIPERDYSSPAAGTSEGDQERQPNPTAPN